MLSDPCSLLVFGKRGAFWTEGKEILWRGKGIVRDTSRGVEMFVSFRVGLEAKGRLKRVALLEEEIAIVSLE